MSAEQFCGTFYTKFINDGVTEKLGSFDLESHMELKYIMLTMFCAMTPTTEQARLKIYPDVLLSGTPIATSDWRNLSTFITSGQKYGFMRFDFNRQYLNKNVTYYLTMETQNYVRTSTHYMTVKLDWDVDDIHTSLSATSRAAQMRIIGYK